MRTCCAALAASLCLFASSADRIREINQSLQNQNGGKISSRSSLPDGLLQERAQLLRGLMAENPIQARSLLLSPKLLAEIRDRRPSSLNQLERPFAYTGPVEITVADMPGERRSSRRYSFETPDGLVSAFGGPDLPLRCGDQATVEGFRIGTSMLVTSAVAVPREAASGGRSAETAEECNVTTGTQKIAAILVNFPGAPAPALTKARVGEILFNATGQSLANFYKEESSGQLSLTGDVFGTYTLDRAYGCDEFFEMRVAALKAADADVNFSGYTRVMVIHPPLDDCTKLGEGTLGCRLLTSPQERFYASYAAIAMDEDMVFTLAHEFGHNLGLDHARTLRFPGVAIGAERALGTLEEYGDLYSAMGFGEGHFGASHKEALGWFRQARDFSIVQAPGVFDLLPLQSSAAGVKALAVKRNTGEDLIWIEYRQPTGEFDGASDGLPASLFQGAIIRAQNIDQPRHSDLLDFSPMSIDEARLAFLPGYFEDPLLRPGQVWSDPYSDLTLEVLSATSDRLRIAVRYDTPCTSVTGLTDGATIGADGRPLAFAVSASSNCSWSAAGSRTWLNVPTGSRRQGPANLSLETQPYTGSLSRRGAVTVERRTIAVSQSGVPATPSVPVFGPTRGSFAQLEWIFAEAVVSDANGVGDMKELFILINDSQTEQNGCVMKFDLATRSLTLKNTASNSYSLDAIGSGEWRFISNSRCGVGYPSAAISNDTDISVWFGYAFQGAVTRPQEIYTMVVDKSGASSGWVRQGSLTFQAGCRVVPRPFRIKATSDGGVAILELNATTEPCPWQLISNTPWITVETPSGDGSDVAIISALPNTASTSRTGTVTLGEHTIQVVQDAKGAFYPSDFQVSPAETLVSSGSGTVTITVNASSDAAWQIANTASWLAVVDRGRDYVILSHDANTATSERNATLTIAGHTVVVRQAAGDPLRPVIADGGVVNAASFLGGFSSGSWFTIRGINLSNTTRTWTGADFDGNKLPTSLDGVRVLVNGKPAFIYYISPTQINALAPNDTLAGAVPVEVDNNGRKSLFDIAVRRTRSPGLFMMPAPVARMAAATLLDGTLVAPPDTFTGLGTRGARAGDVVSFYATGLGATTPAYPEGQLIPAPLPTALPTVTIGGRSAPVSFSGLIGPGLYQINIVVPDVPPGEHEVVITAEGTRSLQRPILYVVP